MTKKNQDFDMYAGDTKDIVVTMSDSANIDGSTVKWGLKKSVKDTMLVSKNTGGLGITVSGTAFTVRLNPSDTLGLSGRYYHEAEVTDVLGNVSTVTVGHITIEPSGV